MKTFFKTYFSLAIDDDRPALNEFVRAGGLQRRLYSQLGKLNKYITKKASGQNMYGVRGDHIIRQNDR